MAKRDITEATSELEQAVRVHRSIVDRIVYADQMDRIAVRRRIGR